jgi:hypothetical protein
MNGSFIRTSKRGARGRATASEYCREAKTAHHPKHPLHVVEAHRLMPSSERSRSVYGCGCAVYYQRWVIWPTAFGGQMSFGRVASLVIAIVAVLALFVEIPIVSDYAFWFLVGALIIWMGVHSQNTKNRFRWQTMLSIALLLVAIVGVFVEIPIVSAYAFWVLFVAYLVSVGSTSFSSN